jgi:DNA-binding transcriptional LysR family regulator
VTSADLALRAVLRDIGVAVLPFIACAEALREGRLERLLGDWSAGAAEVLLVYPSHRHVPARVRAFVDLVAKRAKQIAPTLLRA